MILQSAGRTNRLWIGSANATGRGLDGPNVEIMAEVDVADSIYQTIDAFMQGHEIAVPSELTEAMVEQEAALRALDDALQALLETTFTLEPGDAGLSLGSATDLSSFLENYKLKAWLFTFPDKVTEWPCGAHEILVHESAVPLKFQTALVGFLAEARDNPEIRRSWAQAVEFPGLDVAARDRAATAAYIGASNLAPWFRARLQGITPTETTDWTGLPRNDLAPGPSRGIASPGHFALEEVLAAWARNPAQFEEKALAISSVLDGFRADLNDQPDDEAKDALLRLDELEAFWGAVRECLGIELPNGA
jgi:hypothetical protein